MKLETDRIINVDMSNYNKSEITILDHDCENETMQFKVRVLEFDKPYANGDIFAKGCFDKSNLDNLVLDGEIKDYEIDENGITVIKEFNIRSVSIVPQSMSIRYKD